MNSLNWLFLSMIIAFSSCQSGMYVKSTVNIPTVDTAKKHELIVGGSLACGDIQHNHLIRERLVLAHSMSINTYDFENLESLKHNFKTEIGLGLQAKHPWLVNFGYARREAIIVKAGWTDGDIDEIFIPNIYSFGIQKSFLIPSQTHIYDMDEVFFTAKIDYVNFPIKHVESWSHEKINDLFLDFNFNARQTLNKYFGIQYSFGVKLFWGQTFQPLYLSSHRLANERLYVRLHLLF